MINKARNEQMRKLTIKQEKFCDKYLECGNASQAYRYAFSCEKMKTETINNKAYMLLIKGEVRARVEELKKRMQSKSEITKEKVLAEFAKVGFSSIAHLHNTWIDRKAFEELTQDQKSAIKSISTRTRRIIISEEPVEIEEVKIELYDKLKALDSINKMLGFDAPTKTEITGANGKPLIPEPITVEIIDRTEQANAKDTDN